MIGKQAVTYTSYTSKNRVFACLYQSFNVRSFMQKMSGKIEPVIIVHGGAGDIPNSRVQGKLDGVRKALRAAHGVFLETGSILDATQKAVELMEDDEAFNAGRGSVLTLEGDIEMEALVIEGKHIQAGSVTGLKGVEHPIRVARLVLEHTPHVILSADGVNEFSSKMGVPTVPDEFLKTEAAKIALERFKAKKGIPSKTEIGDVGTVGAVGVDCIGHLVSCTSTGGVTGKMKGRVGDTPIPGAGGYADDDVGAVSTTGYGDFILRYGLAFRIIGDMEHGKSAQEATEYHVRRMLQRVGNTAGAITLSKNGDVGMAFTSKRMAWAYVKGSKIHYGINAEEDFVEDL